MNFNVDVFVYFYLDENIVFFFVLGLVISELDLYERVFIDREGFENILEVMKVYLVFLIN